jgi:hypothetical protein
MRIALREHFNGDAAIFSRFKHVVNWREIAFESHIDHAASDSNNDAFVHSRRITAFSWLAIQRC